ncbi:hypothetical protein [Anaerolinea sp.]|uniref:hypothetical protein n=1 Tax=Anaerolinea sp. TaxID=1872519 RepID=UPI002ACEFDB1|nr:hypothetical protein [Anaerolinea sp.]
MAKKFLTAKDIDFHADQGVKEIHIGDDVVVTDLGQERARERGVTLTRLPAGVKSPPHPSCEAAPSDAEIFAQVRSAVIARFGGTPDGLDQIIQKVLTGKE